MHTHTHTRTRTHTHTHTHTVPLKLNERRKVVTGSAMGVINATKNRGAILEIT